MTIRFPLVTFVVCAFVAGCGPGAPKADEASSRPAPPAKKSKAEARADELLEDLRRREAALARLENGGVAPQVAPPAPQVAPPAPQVAPPAPKVAPPAPSATRSAGAAPSAATTTIAPKSAGNGADADRLRKEFSDAQVRLKANSLRLEQARQRMTEAQSQMKSGSAAVKKTGQDAFNRAQQQVTSAQSAVISDQQAVATARKQALAAGVPASSLR